MRTTQLPALLVAVAVLGACGSDGSDDTVGSSAVTPDAPRSDVTAAVPPSSGPTIVHDQVHVDGTEVEYAVVTPAGYIAGEPAPLLLALPPGGQTDGLRDLTLERTLAAEAAARGWVVVSPSAPGGQLFFEGAERVIPGLLDHVVAEYPPEPAANGRLVHVAGISNGGISAFRIALDEPDRYASITVLPGFPPSDDQEALDRLIDIPVVMFVGENDLRWVSAAEKAFEGLTRVDGEVTLRIEPGEGHNISTLSDGVVLFDLLDSYRS